MRYGEWKAQLESGSVRAVDEEAAIISTLFPLVCRTVIREAFGVMLAHEAGCSFGKRA